MTQQSKIGIYLPTKNRLELLQKAIDSILCQTFQDFQLIVVNDGSTDGTQQYLDSLNDERVSVIHHEKSTGSCASRNEAILALNAELITGLDDDDVFLPHRLEQLLSVYDEKYAFVCSGYYWDYGAHKKALFQSDRTISLSDAFDLNQCSNQILVNRERLLAVGGFDENIPALQDHDLWVRLIAKFGSAFRTGHPSYIVNDDHSLERISSVDNKLSAIEIFEKKHEQIMSVRNKENFAFYKNKISGEPFGIGEYFSSLKHGLFSLKTRQLFANTFKSVSKRRLNYLQSGSFFEHELGNKLVNMCLPLIATGGTGAARVILLSIVVFLFGAEINAAFSNDIFILLFLNVLCCQSFGFYYYKEEFVNNFQGLFKQSIKGLMLSYALILGLNEVDVIKNLGLSLILATTLHVYFMLRVKLLSLKSFFILSVSESFVALLCLILPLGFAAMYEKVYVPYVVYSMGLSIAALFMYLMIARRPYNNKSKIELNKVSKIAIANSVGPFGLFFLPTIVGTFASDQQITIVALCLAFCGVVFLIPRSYANTFLPRLGSKSISYQELTQINIKYQLMVLGSVIASTALCLLYLTALTGIERFELNIMYSALTSLVLGTTQLGFVYLTYLNLAGRESVVLKIHFTVLVLTIILYGIVFSFPATDKTTLTSISLFFCLSGIYVVRKIYAQSVFTKHFKKELS